MPRPGKPSARRNNQEPPTALRELIVVAKSDVALRARGPSTASLAGANVTALNSALAAGHATLTPLFGSEDRVARASSAPQFAVPADPVPAQATALLSQMPSFYKVEAPATALDELAHTLLSTGMVEAAYIRPGAEPPVFRDDPIRKEAIKPTNLEPAPPVSPDFRPRQIFLEPAPCGIDAFYAWTRPGGKGQGVRIIDIEGAWRFSHEDLVQNQGGVIGGVESTALSWRDHGTAVVGVFGADENS